MKFSIAAIQFISLAFLSNSLQGTEARLGDPSNGNGEGNGLDAASSMTIPYFDNCDFGDGFDPTLGCTSANLGSPFDTNTLELQTNPWNEEAKYYTNTLKSSDDISSMMSSVSTLEGSYTSGAFNAKASATFSYATSKQISTNSIAFYL